MKSKGKNMKSLFLILGRVAQPLILHALNTKWVPRSCVLCKGGYHGRLH